MKKILLLFLLLFLFPVIVRATQPELLINEIGWMGTEESWADEWMELYNPTNEQIDLKEWKLMTEDQTLSIELEGTVEPDSFFVLEKTDDETLPEIEADQIYTGGLNNNGQYLKLMKGEQVVQEINDKAGWRAGNSDDYQTMERGQEWHTSREQGGTPRQKNSKPVPKKEQMPAKPLTSSLDQTYSDFWFTLIIALGVSMFSAAIIYFLKKEMRKVESER